MPLLPLCRKRKREKLDAAEPPQLRSHLQPPPEIHRLPSQRAEAAAEKIPGRVQHALARMTVAPRMDQIAVRRELAPQCFARRERTMQRRFEVCRIGNVDHVRLRRAIAE